MAIPFPILLVCPSCRGAVVETPASYDCGRCRRTFPVICGIPDFRLRPDPWIGLEDDRQKGSTLEATTSRSSFAETVAAYWAMTPSTPPHLASRFVDHVLSATGRTREWLERVVLPAHTPAGPWLDLGCGTADLAEAAPPGQPVVGIDVAFRWLIVARRRLNAAGRPAALVCCNAEHLPFPDDSFTRVLSVGLLEHCTDPSDVIGEAARVLAPQGQLALRTVNRYSLLPEPHVGLWGIGYLPRRWTAAYVAWRSGRPYHHRPVSPAEIRRAARGAGLRVRVQPAMLLREDRSRLGRLAVMASAYEYAASVPAAGRGLAWVSPLLDAIARAA